MTKKLHPSLDTRRTFPTEKEGEHLHHYFHATKDEQIEHLMRHGTAKTETKNTPMADRANYHRQLHLNQSPSDSERLAEGLRSFKGVRGQIPKGTEMMERSS